MKSIDEDSRRCIGFKCSLKLTTPDSSMLISSRAKFSIQVVEIISVCYEVGNSIDDYIINVNRLKNKLDLDFTFLIGGSAKKDLASQHFNSLSDIISFPTSIFIDRTGKIKGIHTGFNGPGTGEYYESYKVEVNRLIKSMLIH